VAVEKPALAAAAGTSWDDRKLINSLIWWSAMWRPGKR
jgi:hypothetical protein